MKNALFTTALALLLGLTACATEASSPEEESTESTEQAIGDPCCRGGDYICQSTGREFTHGIGSTCGPTAGAARTACENHCPETCKHSSWNYCN
ncbi:hypothetical protein LZC95_04420 [Pendulispora brunnea]|uniref:Lipoprotein n=1 Tax=Pendulispora brunnea TaxID=2905690 RepID=A0ABZ2KGM9_9BACT